MDERNRIARQHRRHYRTRELVTVNGQRRRLVLTINSPQVIRIPRRPNNANEALHINAADEHEVPQAALEDALANLNLNNLLAVE